MAAGLEPQAIREKYYFARRPEITRVVDISGQIEKKIAANQANTAKGPAGHPGSRMKADLAANGLKLPILGDDDFTADREYIRQFGMARSRDLGARFGLEYAEAFHYIGPRDRSVITDYVDQNTVPLK